MQPACESQAPDITFKPLKVDLRLHVANEINFLHFISLTRYCLINWP